jgi:hypothetical protein
MMKRCSAKENEEKYREASLSSAHKIVLANRLSGTYLRGDELKCPTWNDNVDEKDGNSIRASVMGPCWRTADTPQAAEKLYRLLRLRRNGN